MINGITIIKLNINDWYDILLFDFNLYLFVIIIIIIISNNKL